MYACHANVFYICTYLLTYVLKCNSMWTYLNLQTCMYICMCICVGIHMCMCVYIRIYMLHFNLAVCFNVLSCPVCQVWDYETIDNADITEDNTQFEMEPLTEIRVGTKVSIKSLVRSMDPDMSTMWYAQDASGAIWKVDIIDSHTVSKVQCQHHARALYM